MFDINAMDFLQIKYLFLTTGFFTKEKLAEMKNINVLVEELKNKYDSFNFNNLLNESFYYLKLYNVMHANGSCPSQYKNKPWGDKLNAKSIFIVRLFQNLRKEEFFRVLLDCFGISENEYYNLEMDVDKYDLEDHMPKINQYLCESHNSFYPDIQSFLNRQAIDILCPQSEIAQSNHRPGVCLVINNENFIKLDRRDGTEFDEKNIQKIFQNLGFYVFIKSDLRLSDMSQCIAETKSLIRNDDEKLVVFVLSHGKEDHFFTSDDKNVSFYELSKPFSNDELPKLSGKPKLFFFVCCQGDSHHEGVSKDSEIAQGDNVFDNIQFDGLSTFPRNFFFGYATYKSFYSYRQTTKGTFYVRELCKAICDNRDKPITEIHVIVQKQLSQDPTYKDIYFQMPYYRSSLTENCFL